jgi:LCP family protein required for cell wall assembly
MNKKKSLDDAVKINLLDKKDNSNPKGKKIFKVSKFITYLFIILIIVFSVFSFQVILSGGEKTSFPGFKFFKNMGQLLKGHENKLQGEEQDRINILLLGNGGAGHDGANLTDTIMLASIKPSTKKVALMSIPRDLLIPLPGYGMSKINNAYAFAEAKTEGTGGIFATQTVSEFLDLEIPYFVQVDFEGFEQFIDDLGGLDIYVERTFTDYQYPTLNHKYQVVYFEEGNQHMNGDEALKYVRSRHGNNGEAGDFARSKRQQKVLRAIKEKVASYKTFLNPKRISNLLSTFSEHSSTNMEIWEIVRLAKMTQNLDTENIITEVLDDSPNGVLYGTKYGEAFVLRPRKKDFSDLQFIAKNIFIQEQEIDKKQTAKIEIKNGTKVNGLAGRTSQKLQKLGYDVLKIGNAPTQNYEKSEIYFLSDKDKKEIGDILQNIFNADISTDIPDWVEKLANPQTDFYIILGKDNGNL